MSSSFFPHAPLVDCGYVIVSGGDSIHLASLISFFYFSRHGHLCFTVDFIYCCCFICPHNSRFISFRFILTHLTNNRCLQRKVGPVRQSGHSWQGCSGAGRRRSHSHPSTKVNKNFDSNLAPLLHNGRISTQNKLVGGRRIIVVQLKRDTWIYWEKINSADICSLNQTFYSLPKWRGIIFFGRRLLNWLGSVTEPECCMRNIGIMGSWRACGNSLLP